MSLKNFRAVDFKNNGSGVTAVPSKRDKLVRREEKTPQPTTKPIIAEDANENDVPNGTVPEILTWVGANHDRAQAALDKENENDKPRKGLVTSLEGVLLDAPEPEDKPDEDSDNNK